MNLANFCTGRMYIANYETTTCHTFLLPSNTSQLSFNTSPSQPEEFDAQGKLFDVHGEIFEVFGSSGRSTRTIS